MIIIVTVSYGFYPSMVLEPEKEELQGKSRKSLFLVFGGLIAELFIKIEMVQKVDIKSGKLQFSITRFTNLTIPRNALMNHNL